MARDLIRNAFFEGGHRSVPLRGEECLNVGDEKIDGPVHCRIFTRIGGGAFIDLYGVFDGCLGERWDGIIWPTHEDEAAVDALVSELTMRPIRAPRRRCPNHNAVVADRVGDVLEKSFCL